MFANGRNPGKAAAQKSQATTKRVKRGKDLLTKKLLSPVTVMADGEERENSRHDRKAALGEVQSGIPHAGTSPKHAASYHLLVEDAPMELQAEQEEQEQEEQLVERNRVPAVEDEAKSIRQDLAFLLTAIHNLQQREQAGLKNYLRKVKTYNDSTRISLIESEGERVANIGKLFSVVSDIPRDLKEVKEALEQLITKRKNMHVSAARLLDATSAFLQTDDTQIISSALASLSAAGVDIAAVNIPDTLITNSDASSFIFDKINKINLSAPRFDLNLLDAMSVAEQLSVAIRHELNLCGEELLHLENIREQFRLRIEPSLVLYDGATEKLNSLLRAAQLSDDERKQFFAVLDYIEKRQLKLFQMSDCFKYRAAFLHKQHVLLQDQMAKITQLIANKPKALKVDILGANNKKLIKRTASVFDKAKAVSDHYRLMIKQVLLINQMNGTALSDDGKPLAAVIAISPELEAKVKTLEDIMFASKEVRERKAAFEQVASLYAKKGASDPEFKDSKDAGNMRIKLSEKLAELKAASRAALCYRFRNLPHLYLQKSIMLDVRTELETKALPGCNKMLVKQYLAAVSDHLHLINVEIANRTAEIHAGCKPSFKNVVKHYLSMFLPFVDDPFQLSEKNSDYVVNSISREYVNFRNKIGVNMQRKALLAFDEWYLTQVTQFVDAHLKAQAELTEAKVELKAAKKDADLIQAEQAAQAHADTCASKLQHFIDDFAKLATRAKTLIEADFQQPLQAKKNQKVVVRSMPKVTTAALMKKNPGLKLAFGWMKARTIKTAPRRHSEMAMSPIYAARAS